MKKTLLTILFFCNICYGTDAIFNQNGNVGINTSTPSAVMQVLSKTGGNGFILRVSSQNGSTNILSIKENGFMGIGKTNPVTALDIKGDFTVNPGTICQVNLYSYCDSLNWPPFFIGNRSRGSETSPTSIVSGDTLFTILSYGYTNAWRQSGFISFACDNTPSGAIVPTSISFITQDGSGNMIPRAAWGSNGDFATGSLNYIDSTGGRIRTITNANDVRFSWPGDTYIHFIVDTTDVAQLKGTKSFIIQHPLNKDKYLIHACIEAPENAVFYRGTSQLVDGVATICLPDYFEALTSKINRTIQLTNVDGFDILCIITNRNGSQIKDGKFSIIGNNKKSNQQFNWEVKAIRKDVKPLLVEPDKNQVNVYGGNSPYKYYTTK